MNPTTGNDMPRRSSIFQGDGYQSTGFGGRMVPPGMESQIDADGRDPSRLTSPSGTSQGGMLYNFFCSLSTNPKQYQLLDHQIRKR